jgi:uncharacterized metal-binding protein YceD (DUF177 family)
MNYGKQFIIPVTGLKPGSHPFEFEIDDSFFEDFEYSEIHNGLIHMSLVVEKEENLLVFHFDFRGLVKVPCDRCYELFDLPIEGNQRLILKFGSDYHEESEEIQVVPIGENHFDVSPFIYEYVHLALPVRRVHPENETGENTCAEEINSRLEDLSSSSGPDPRWEALTQLKNMKLKN